VLVAGEQAPFRSGRINGRRKKAGLARWPSAVIDDPAVRFSGWVSNRDFLVGRVGMIRGGVDAAV